MRAREIFVSFFRSDMDPLFLKGSDQYSYFGFGSATLFVSRKNSVLSPNNTIYCILDVNFLFVYFPGSVYIAKVIF